MGHLHLVFKLRIDNFEDQIYEDNREIEKHYYDPFVTDEFEIGRVSSLLFTAIYRTCQKYQS